MPVENIEQAQNGLCVLHRASFVEWKPSPVVSVASSVDGSLAVACRENGDVELYETANIHRLQRLPGHADAAPTCVAVVDDAGTSRIYSAGLDGNITEHNVDTLQPAAISDAYGGAVWQLAPEPLTTTTQPSNKPPPTTSTEAAAKEQDQEDDDEDTPPSPSPRIAAACDDGAVRLFTVDGGLPGVTYNKTLPRVEGRILTVAWHPSGLFLASGGTSGCIHVWEVATNREVYRITAADATGKELCIWSLVYLPDGTLVSGDSDGNVCMWEGQFGTRIAKFTQHKADVLTVTASPDGSTVFAAGVDPQISVFKKLQSDPGAAPKWVYLSSKRTHTHDVRALCIVHGKHAVEPTLWSGGNDTLLYCHAVDRFLKEHPSKVENCPQRPLLQAIPEVTSSSSASNNTTPTPWLLAAQEQHVDIWQLADPAVAYIEPSTVVEGAPIPLAGQPWHLARISNRSGRYLLAATASTDGGCIAFSDTHRTTCFAIQPTQLMDELLADGEDPDEIAAAFGVGMGGGGGGLNFPPKINVVPIEYPSELPTSTHLVFRPGRARELITCSLDGTIRLLQLPTPSEDHQQNSEEEEDNGGDGTNKSNKLKAEVVHVIRAIHDVRYKMWFKRDRTRNTARHFAAAVDHLVPSPDGAYLAVGVRGRVFVVSLETGHIVCQLPPLAEHAPVTAISFTGDSASLVAVGAGNEVNVVTVPEGEPLSTTTMTATDGGGDGGGGGGEGQSGLPQRWRELPGPIVGAVGHPGESDAVMVFSPEAVCYIDFSKPIAEQRKPKRRRKHKDLKIATPAGENCRALYCDDPVLYVEFLQHGSLLVVERAWSEVWKGLPPPMYRHRYGT